MIKQAALEHIDERAPPRIMMDKFRVFEDRVFACREEWESYLAALGLGEMKVTPDLVLIATSEYLRLRGTLRHAPAHPNPQNRPLDFQKARFWMRGGRHRGRAAVSYVAWETCRLFASACEY